MVVIETKRERDFFLLGMSIRGRIDTYRLPEPDTQDKTVVTNKSPLYNIHFDSGVTDDET